MNEKWPLGKSKITKKTPTKNISPKINKIVTRLQQRLQNKKKINSNQDSETSDKENKPSTSKQATEDKTPKTIKKEEKQITPIENRNQTVNQQIKMEGKMTVSEIHQLISSGIPEFSEENNDKLHKNFTRFIEMADNTYNSLKSPEEKAIFDNFIKIKLTDEAFDRVYSRNLKTYPEIKKFLLDVYSETKTLEELEKEFTNIKQAYGETVNNYGNRLLDALNKYKRMYRQKYNIPDIDETYNKHLQTNSLRIFKRGLNNIPIRDKILTSSADNIEEIIKETEQVEKVILDINTQPENNTSTQSITQQIIYPSEIRCKFCQEPGHTWVK